MQNNSKKNFKKQLGQHFIFDQNFTDKIVNCADDLAGSCVLEIGPGAGTLTKSILKKNPKKLIAVEKDRDCLPALLALKQNHLNLEIINADALTINEAELFDERFKIIANLPYNVGSELLVKWLKIPNQQIESMILMFQKEVAERIVAKPNSKAYGRISVLVDLLCEAKLLFKVSPKVFTPPPRVESAIVKLVFRKTPLYPIPIETIENVCRIAFNQRRKMIRSSLKPLFSNPAEVLEKMGINPNLRAENLTTEQFYLIGLEAICNL